jgi:hypothetical protein
MVVAQAEINFHSILPDFEFLGILAQLTSKRPAATSYFYLKRGNKRYLILEAGKSLAHAMAGVAVIDKNR